MDRLSTSMAVSSPRPDLLKGAVDLHVHAGPNRHPPAYCGGNHELLGLLLMTFGLVEVFSLLSGEVKEMLRGVN